MIPQDSRSPFRQQRHVILENYGSLEIPAFAACEIVGSYRTEIGDDNQSGRLVYRVTRPTASSLPNYNVAFCGPKSISVGSRGNGTLDFPTHAIYLQTTTPFIGSQWGTVENSFSLGPDETGFVCHGDVANGIMWINIVGGGTTRDNYVAWVGDEPITARSGTPPSTVTAGQGVVTIYRMDTETLEMEPQGTKRIYSWVCDDSPTNVFVRTFEDSFGTFWYDNTECCGTVQDGT